MHEHNGYFPDLCILSHQLHAQTLIFPVDPYYILAGVGACTGQTSNGYKRAGRQLIRTVGEGFTALLTAPTLY
jgi:hypothetical protein